MDMDFHTAPGCRCQGGGRQGCRGRGGSGRGRAGAHAGRVEEAGGEGFGSGFLWKKQAYYIVQHVLLSYMSFFEVLFNGFKLLLEV